MNRDREHVERMMQTAREMTQLAKRGLFRTEPIVVERVHLRAIFFTESADKLSSGFKDRYSLNNREAGVGQSEDRSF